MNQFGGRDSAGPTLQDAEALLRSLVGVAAVSIRTSPDGALREIVVVPESEILGRQVSRNVTSALMARFGLDLAPDTISIAAPAADTSSGDAQAGSHGPADSRPATGTPGREPVVKPSDPAARSPDPAAPEQAGGARTANGTNGTPRNGVAHDRPARPNVTNGKPAEPQATVHAGVRTLAPFRPRLELVEFGRAGTTLRCRVVVAAGSERFVGVGDADSDRTTDIELAGRVAIDALRAARTPRDPIQFDGAALVDVAGRAHVAVSLSVWTGSDFETIAGAAPVTGSPAQSAAEAVIDSVVARLIA